TLRRPGLWLLLSGLCWGLALETHPTVLALLPGALVFLVWQGRALWRARGPFLAGVLFLAGNLPFRGRGLANGFGVVSEGRVRSGTYTRNERLTPPVYARRLTTLAPGLLRYLGGAVDQRQIDNPAEILADPGLWPMALLAAAGLVWQWRRGNRLPALLLLSMA